MYQISLSKVKLFKSLCIWSIIKHFNKTILPEMMWKIAASAKEIRNGTTILDLSATNRKI